MKKVLEIKSEYSGQFKIVKFSCDACRDFGPVLAADNSGDEYGPVYICRKCLEKAFAEFEKDEK